MLTNYKNTSTERFLRYVQIDTQSDPNSSSQPSTLKQKDLSKVLVQELIEMGVKDAHLDEFGYVYATIPSNSAKNVPVICFCSHVDTSPDCSGAGVKPIIHPNYQGHDIVLPDDHSQILKLAEHPDLAYQYGNDIITASGTTLLGADNKAGVAEIMDAAYHLVNNPDIAHGTIKILFTPDEEIGRGTAAVDLQKLGADFGYTIDGETLGSLEDETFSADGVKITIQGVSQHPGFAKGRMESALKIAADIVANLPKDSLSPETTEGMEGFIHPVGITGMVETATIEFIIRDFSEEKLHAHEAKLKEIMEGVLANYPHSKAIFEVFEQYRNMKEVLDKTPQVTAYALEAIQRSGIEAKQMSIRGGTDGSRLSFMGLPCPNIFAGEHAFHGKHEWVSVQDMEKATETIINLCKIWEEKTQ
ncbi:MULTISPECIES: peptidase T [unclassified Arcicella]|uniref:peptidase T n=1 Tax=unclassified Arcicella TaxID=2644986 RepID=UPI002855FC68|nr:MULTISPECIES: peptidase T [unclassified Arcicella]MDR6561063.1 tripeptide aminopeptidase [Arcicella sp. BE51]MDR6810947.1 tripeptide aminopeptidase [Arcicella sp. BE140]MDR6822297.1 tripeptide aminopeptidase [Arcicella sp. BE139]